MDLNRFIREKIKKGSAIFVSHPGYGYFCRDYGIEQISLEHEGKDPTSKQLSKTLAEVKKDHLREFMYRKNCLASQHNLLQMSLVLKLWF